MLLCFLIIIIINIIIKVVGDSLVTYLDTLIRGFCYKQAGKQHVSRQNPTDSSTFRARGESGQLLDKG